MQSLEQEIGDKNVLRRLSLLLALKEAYIKAAGEPDIAWKRLEFNIGPTHETVRGDNHPLQGWEFRIFPILDKHYICVCAFFREEERKLQWYTEDTDEYKKWVQFLSIDQMVVPELFLS
jgi:4'-phosphopantetheinyl transferase